MTISVPLHAVMIILTTIFYIYPYKIWVMEGIILNLLPVYKLELIKSY